MLFRLVERDSNLVLPWRQHSTILSSSAGWAMLQLEMMSEKYLPWAFHWAFLGHYNDSSTYSFMILNNAVLMFGIFYPVAFCSLNHGFLFRHIAQVVQKSAE